MDTSRQRSESEIDKHRNHQNPTPSACPNTYRLRPKNNGVFSTTKVRPILESVLSSNLNTYKYNAKTSGELCKRIADESKQRIKQLGYNRYKLVTQCLIFSNNTQSVRFASRYLWDEKLDNFVSVTTNGEDFTCTVMVAAVYFE